MYVVEVMPVSKSAGAESYSYFSSVPYDNGTIVSIPVRSREETGIVLKSEPVSALKTALRAATFALRRLPVHEFPQRLSPTLLKLAESIADREAIMEGAALSAILPKTGSIVLALERDTRFVPEKTVRHVPELFAAPTSDRMIAYQSIVREAFASGTSLLFVAPTIEDAESAYRKLSGGIEEYTTLLHSGRKISEIRAAEKLITETLHPLFIITTPAFAFIERPDIGVVIVERSRAHGYRAIARPLVDYKEAIITHAKLSSRRIILSDTLPSADDEWRLREGIYVAYDEHPKRLALPGVQKIIKQKKDGDAMIPFKLFSDELVAGIQDVMKKKGRAFLFAARRGLAPVVGCIDCGHILRDPESGSPLSLHRVVIDGIEKRYLVSSTSGYKEEARDLCPQCGSWRLRERGIGIQHVETELRSVLPNTPVLLFDHTTAGTHKKAEKLRDMFYGLHSQVLLGTALALPYIEKQVSLSAIVSMDSLLAIPSWRQQEESLGIILALREKTKGPVLIQTRHRADDSLLSFAARGDLSSFYDEELAIREEFTYPPFSVFIHLSYRGTKPVIEKTEMELKSLFAGYELSLYGSLPREDGTVLRQGLIRRSAASWPDQELAKRLRSLHPGIRVEINPDRIV